MAKVMFVNVATWTNPDPEGAMIYGVIALDTTGQLWERVWNGECEGWGAWQRIEAPEEILDAL